MSTLLCPSCFGMKQLPNIGNLVMNKCQCCDGKGRVKPEAKIESFVKLDDPLLDDLRDKHPKPVPETIKAEPKHEKEQEAKKSKLGMFKHNDSKKKA